jgi:hypothetical protein
MYQFNKLLKKVQIYLLKKIHLGKKFHHKKIGCVFGVIIFKQHRSNISKTEACNNHFSFVDEKCS